MYGSGERGKEGGCREGGEREGEKRVEKGSVRKPKTVCRW